MSKNYKNTDEYTWSFNADAQTVTKKHNTSAKVWSWVPKPRPKGPRCNPSNGVTIKKLQEAGHSVRIRHLRWANYLAINESIKKRKKKDALEFKPHAICVPSTFRKDPLYVFEPKGGYTHIVIKPNGHDKYICLSSECSKEDPFCYATGVEKALERLTSFELGYLGLDFNE